MKVNKKRPYGRVQPTGCTHQYFAPPYKGVPPTTSNHCVYNTVLTVSDGGAEVACATSSTVINCKLHFTYRTAYNLIAPCLYNFFYYAIQSVINKVKFECLAFAICWDKRKKNWRM